MVEQGPILRAMRSGDATVVAVLHAASWRSAYRDVLTPSYLEGDILREREAHWAERLAAADDSQFGILAEVSGVPVAFAYAFANQDLQYGHLLDNIHVAPERAGHGIGTVLLAGVAREIIRRPWNSLGLYLWVYETNHGARRFYKRHGASHRGTELHFGADGSKVIACRYVWEDVTDLARPAPRVAPTKPTDAGS